MNKLLIFFVSIPALFLVCSSAIAQSPASTQEIKHTSENIEFLVYLPKDYHTSTGKTYPLLLFLHGKGERGDNIEMIKRHGPPKLINEGEWDPELPFVVISPQLSSEHYSWPTDIINNVFDEVIQKYKIDEARVYLTGLSLGGIAAWQYAVEYPERLAAFIPVCGWGNGAMACNLKEMPVWAFHGELDEVVKPKGSINMINAVKRCPNRNSTNTKLTLYPNVGHNSWEKAYSDPTIYTWLLQFSKEKEATTNAIPKEVATVTLQSTQNDAADLEELCELPESLPESSGLQYYANGLVWTHNDSGNQPVLYQIDTMGRVNQFKRITNAANFDWEDLAKDDEGNLYIGDFGNNKNDRKSFQIYKIGNPEKTKEERIAAEVITYAYPDQKSFPPAKNNLNFDVEAMIAFDNHLYLFTKNRTIPYSGYVKLYKLPNTPGEYTAELIDSLHLNNNDSPIDWITGADISPDKKKIVLLSSHKVWLIQDFKGDKFFEGRIETIQLPHITQKEGITFISNNAVYISDEKFKNTVGGKLYHLDLSPFIEL